MKEEYLHYIWQYGLFEISDLKTTAGDEIVIVSKGVLNHNAGPDFLNARIKIGGTLWAGNVELHLRSSDWLKHRHQNDPAYNNVILHVVLLDDRTIVHHSGSKFPTLSLSSRIDIDHFERYNRLVGNTFKIACENQIGNVDDITVQSVIERMGVVRLERKTNYLLTELEGTNNNWRQLYFQLLARNFGMKVNAIPFETLSKSIDLNILSKHIDHPIQVEALLFGQSGLLDRDLIDDYPVRLRKEYLFLKKKYKLNQMSSSAWKFMRMRPSNFPTIRIAQLAAYLIKNKGLTELNFKDFKMEALKESFRFDIQSYWNNRYRFDKLSTPKSKRFGRDSFYNILINTVVPVLFAYGTYHYDQKIKDMAFDILAEIPAENNSIVKHWNRIGIAAENAFDSQALLELRNQFCFQKKCLNCNIGVSLLKDVVLND